METQLNKPTQAKIISDDNAKRIAAFKDLIITYTNAPDLKSNLLSAYFNYSQLLVKHCEEPHHNAINELYNLQLIIEILE